MKNPVVHFLFRWLVSGLGIWIAAALLKASINYDHSAAVIIIAGLVLAIINTVLKPLVVILSLPALLLSLGLFMIIINGFMVFLVTKLYPQLHITNFGAAIVAGMIIGLVNYLVSAILETR